MEKYAAICTNEKREDKCRKSVAVSRSYNNIIKKSEDIDSTFLYIWITIKM